MTFPFNDWRNTVGFRTRKLPTTSSNDLCLQPSSKHQAKDLIKIKRRYQEGKSSSTMLLLCILSDHVLCFSSIVLFLTDRRHPHQQGCNFLLQDHDDEAVVLPQGIFSPCTINQMVWHCRRYSWIAWAPKERSRTKPQRAAGCWDGARPIQWKRRCRS